MLDEEGREANGLEEERKSYSLERSYSLGEDSGLVYYISLDKMSQEAVEAHGNYF